MSLFDHYREELSQQKVARIIKETEAQRRRDELLADARAAAQTVYESVRSLHGKKGIVVSINNDSNSIGGKSITINTGQHEVLITLGIENDGPEGDPFAVFRWRVSQGTVLAKAGGWVSINRVEKKFEKVFGRWFRPYILKLFTEDEIING